MVTPERLEKISRAFALLKDAADNVRTAQELVLEMSVLHADILDRIHNKVETEALIYKKWMDNEMYDLRRPTPFEP